MRCICTTSRYLYVVILALTSIIIGCPPNPTTILTQTYKTLPMHKKIAISFDNDIVIINKSQIIVYKLSANEPKVITKVHENDFDAWVNKNNLVITLKNAKNEEGIISVLLNTGAVLYKNNAGTKFFYTVSQAYDYITKQYYKNIDEQSLIDNTLRGMTQGLDRYSIYRNSAETKTYWENLSGTFGGVGIHINTGKDEQGGSYIQVIDTIDNSPASKADMQSNDLIISIDGKSTKDMSTKDAAKLMRGKPGTKVVLEIKRKDKGSTKVLPITITRAIIKTTHVQHRILSKDSTIAYLAIKEFTRNTSNDVKKALEALNTKEYKTLIIDLRNNPGGLLNSVIEIAAYFLDKGKLIVGTQSRNKHWNREIFSDITKPLVDKDKKIVVIINGLSASASEILAGAIRFNNRGILVGEKTFGKGLVQSTSVLPKGTMTFTIAEYYVAGKHFINKKGISPDIEIKNISASSKNSDYVLEETIKKIQNGEIDNRINTIKNSP